jgi:hypothetical protein
LGAERRALLLEKRIRCIVFALQCPATVSVYDTTRGFRRAYSSADSVGYVAASALSILACVDYLDVEVGVFVEDLLDTTVVAALLGFDPARLRYVFVIVIVVVVVAVSLVVVKGLVVVGRLWPVVVGYRGLRAART